MNELWPELRWEDWSATADTLHMWTQIVGKTRLALCPMQQHWWQVPLYVTARGLNTAGMPCGAEMLEIEFDFVDHVLRFRSSTGRVHSMALKAMSVAAFYAEYQKMLAKFACEVVLWGVPVEVATPIAFAEDEVHAAYDVEAAHRFWRVLLRVDAVLQRFTAGFVGKVSPVHFFWGSFDLAVTRFSGRPAPPREGVDRIQREAYSEEVISAGFWPGNGGFGKAAFYCYAAPVPEGMSEKAVGPKGAVWDSRLGEFVLAYEDVRTAADPEAALMEFLETAYVAGAEAAGWDRERLERRG